MLRDLADYYRVTNITGTGRGNLWPGSIYSTQGFDQANAPLESDALQSVVTKRRFPMPYVFLLGCASDPITNKIRIMEIVSG
jgi:hypothetical protein